MIDEESCDGTLTCALDVKDLNKSTEWYQKVLGFKIYNKKDEIGWCEFITPIKGVFLGIGQVENPEIKGGATVTFGVKDIDAMAKEFREKGVKMESDPYTIDDYVKLVTFYDPDGNKFMLAQTL